jgi:hypothetical protein
MKHSYFCYSDTLSARTRARWLDGEMVEDFLGNDLSRERLRMVDLETRTYDEQMRMVVSRSGAVVAVLD